MRPQTRQYKQLIQGKRYQFEAILGIGCMQKTITVLVNVSE